MCALLVVVVCAGAAGPRRGLHHLLCVSSVQYPAHHRTLLACKFRLHRVPFTCCLCTCASTRTTLTKALHSLVLSLLCSPPHPQQPAARSNPQRGPTLLDSAMNSLLEETRILHEEIDRTRCSPPPRVPTEIHFHGGRSVGCSATVANYRDTSVL